MHDYNPEKMVEAFKMLQCEVYIGKDIIKVEFPEHVNDFHVKELKLAFKKAKRSLYEYLLKSVGYKLKLLKEGQIVRIL